MEVLLDEQNLTELVVTMIETKTDKALKVQTEQEKHSQMLMGFVYSIAPRYAALRKRAFPISTKSS